MAGKTREEPAKGWGSDQTVMQLIEKIRTELIRSNGDRRHPFRYFHLATFGDYPEVRTLVLREFGPDWSILFYTDARTPKVQELRQNSRVSALFYHPKKQLQLRIKGTASVIDPQQKDYHHYLKKVEQSPFLQDYTSVLPPGAPVMDASGIEYGEQIHFLPVLIRALELDILQLGREKHQRRAYFLKGERWEEVVLVP